MEDDINPARTGIFTYDWDAGFGQYEKAPYTLFVSPANPLKLEDLDEEFGTVLERICFNDSCYAVAKWSVIGGRWSEKTVWLTSFHTENLTFQQTNSESVGSWPKMSVKSRDTLNIHPITGH